MLGVTDKKKAPKRAMSDGHKAALAAGREEGRAVRRYLEALDANRPKRGRKRTADSISRRVEVIDDELVGADPLRRVLLIQERIDLGEELAGLQDATDVAELEHGFVAVARSFSERRGISYAAWREAGVSASVLKQAGITRSM